MPVPTNAGAAAGAGAYAGTRFLGRVNCIHCQFGEPVDFSNFDRATLDQVVYYAVQERLETIVAPGSLKSEIFNLLLWANENNKVAAIVRAARKESPGSVPLRQFADYAQAKWPGSV